MTKLLLATNNPGKIIELKALLAVLNFEIVLPGMVGLVLTVEEDGLTYSENALKKAKAFARASGLLSLADDSGLEVDALGGAPGLHSRRYAPKSDATDADRREVLLRNLTGKPRPWLAVFHAAIAVATPDGRLLIADGLCRGEIIPEERGTGGFGYDPIFLVAGTEKTMAELSLEVKNRLSHRARAVSNAKPHIEELIRQ